MITKTKPWAFRFGIVWQEQGRWKTHRAARQNATKFYRKTEYMADGEIHYDHKKKYYILYARPCPIAIDD